MGDVQCDVLFAQPRRPHGTRIVTAVSWIEHHAFDRAPPGRARLGGRRLRHVDDESKGFGEVENPMKYGFAEVQDQARPFALFSEAHPLYQTTDVIVGGSVVASALD